MRNYIAILLVIILGFCAWLVSRPTTLTPQQVSRLEAAHNVDQLILIGGTGGSDALFAFYEKRGGLWRTVLTAPAYIGKNGLGKTREGDAKTPTGIFHFTKAFGIAPDPGCALGYTQVEDAHYWVGDGASPLYNRFADIRDGYVFDKAESEHLIEYTKPYQYCLNISYNENGTPGLGSAIFLHCYSNRSYTGGCVAIPEDDMRRVLRSLRPGCRLVIAALEDLDNF